MRPLFKAVAVRNLVGETMSIPETGESQSKKRIPVYKLVNGVFVKVGEIPREDAIREVRCDEPDVVDVEAYYIIDEEPVEILGEEVHVAEFDLAKELKELKKLEVKWKKWIEKKKRKSTK